ncbi:MAG: T9SS type A sorting domain-containing protein [Bacteroidetes bacterium]|nr:T9SS type A sorting domain-containing protein [Bacteroidota bacterium]
MAHKKHLQIAQLLTKITFCIGVIISFTITKIHAQAVNIEWQQVYGGSSTDGAYDIDATADGGYITGGYSYSGISGNKTATNYGDSDYWVVKTDSVGNIEWQKTYGGSAFEQVETLSQTADGGYILGGYSVSGISGNKTEANVAGSIDLWIVKIDATGNITWQNAIGGNGSDYLGSIYPTADGGYIVGAYSFSGISGDKTEAVVGFSADYWILKLNSSGNIVWQNTIGGTGNDYCYRAKEAADGSFIVSGVSNSPISGDKTENSAGGVDVWVLKLDNSGNIVWQNTLTAAQTETAFEMDITSDGGAVIGTQTYSNSSVDKSENNISGGITSNDYWIIKLDASGNVEWENTIGGTSFDHNHALLVMNSGEIVVSGYSQSPISGDKTQPLIGLADFWLVKLDAAGNIIYDKTMGGTAADYCYGLTETLDGRFVMCGSSASTISGDKTLNTFGLSDFWLLKIDDICEATTEICNTIDDDCDGLIDEELFVDITVTADGPLTFCQGATVTLTATHNGAGLQWRKNGASIPGATGATYTVNQKGTYSCIAFNDCDSDTSENIIVTVNKNPSATISAGGPTSFCAGGSVSLTETPSGGCTYQWYKGATAIAGATSLNYVATTPGNYKCRVTKAATGCFKNSNSIAVFVPCKEGEELKENSTFVVYPNPAKDKIYIQTNSLQINTVTIFNSVGQVVNKYSDVSVEDELDISNLAKGMYFISVANSEVTITKTFVKD